MLERTEQRTSANPKTIGSTTFYCYRVGILRYRWISEDGRLIAGRNGNRSTYYGTVNGVSLQKRFRTLENAMKAAVAAVQ